MNQTRTLTVTIEGTLEQAEHIREEVVGVVEDAWERERIQASVGDLELEEMSTRNPPATGKGWKPTQAEITAIAERWIYHTAHNGSAHLCNGIAKDILALR